MKNEKAGEILGGQVEASVLLEIFPKVRDPDRIRPEGSIGSLLNEETVLFYKTSQGLFKEKKISQEDLTWLKKEFEKYFEKLVFACRELGENIVLADFFKRMAGNGWLAIRQESIRPVIQKRSTLSASAKADKN